MTKLQQFIIRNRKRNSHLYSNEKIEGLDYVKCPISGERLSMIKRSYVEKILLMTMDEYLRANQGVKLICDARVENIRRGVNIVDPITGKTKHEISVDKSIISRNIIGSDGLTVNARKGKKTRATHMANIDANGLNGYERIAITARPKQIETMAKEKKCASSSEKYEWECYKNFVIWLTSSYKEEILAGLPTGRAGVSGAYHVDHIYSIINGFKNKISPFVIADKSNLRAIPWRENVKKNHSSAIEKETLFETVQYIESKSNDEFERFINVLSSMKHEKYTSARVLELFNEYKK